MHDPFVTDPQFLACCLQSQQQLRPLVTQSIDLMRQLMLAFGLMSSGRIKARNRFTNHGCRPLPRQQSILGLSQ